MLHKEFWGLLFLGFVFWIISASTPQARIENGCRPVAWTGNVVTSLSALALPAHQQKIQGWFDKLEYGCRYTVWRLFYQDSYNAWKRTLDAATPPAGAASAPATAASAPASAASKPAQ